jgi:DNA-binding response OmpR family regulator
MKRALIFERDAGTRIALVRILGRLGWEVDATHDFERALSCFDKRQPDIVLLSWPGDEGVWLLTTFKADRDRRATPVVVMADAQVDIDAEAAVELGANDILRKPVSASAVRIVTDRWVVDRMDPASCASED